MQNDPTHTGPGGVDPTSIGDSLNPVVDAMRRDGKLQWIHVRHEEEAAFAAGAEAQLSGRLAACAGSCGPGNVHLINGLYDAQRSNAPVLAHPGPVVVDVVVFMPRPARPPGYAMWPSARRSSLECL